MDTIHAVTGPNGYTGKYITRGLLAQEVEVIGLTNHPARPSEFGEQVRLYPFDFDQPERLAAHLRGVDVLYNTYWVRFDHGAATFELAVRNTQTLIRAAEQAGVRRIVHVSITNPALDSPLAYFRGKARLEADIRAARLSYAILRPTVLFGLEDILINNIAYLLRKFPLFAIPGDGEYRLQPIYVDDFAQLALQSAFAGENFTRDAVGPDIFNYNALVDLIAGRIGRRPPILHLPPPLVLGLGSVLGRFFGDVLLTREEYLGLSADLLVSDQPPACPTRLDDWLAQHSQSLGAKYASEIARHYQP